MHATTPEHVHGDGLILQSERLVLRPIRIDDVVAYQSYRGRHDVTRYITHEPLSLEASAARLATAVAFWQRYPSEWFNANLAVELAEPGTGTGIIGDTKAWNLLADGSGPATEDPRIFWIGYAFHPDMQGRGYAFEAAARTVRWLFEEHGAIEVRAIAWTPNTASVGLLSKLGLRVFREVGAELETGPKKYPAVHMRILRSEWQAAHGAADSAPEAS